MLTHLHRPPELGNHQTDLMAIDPIRLEFHGDSTALAHKGPGYEGQNAYCRRACQMCACETYTSGQNLTSARQVHKGCFFPCPVQSRRVPRGARLTTFFKFPVGRALHCFPFWFRAALKASGKLLCFRFCIVWAFFYFVCIFVFFTGGSRVSTVFPGK